MTFRDSEKRRYRELKPKLFSPSAQVDGTFRKCPRQFCLADDCSCENLFSQIRIPAIHYFDERHIRWHDGLADGRLPSNHLCCSQSCCINFLYPLVSKPNLIASVFGQFYPDLAEPLTIDKDLRLQDGSFPYVAFEWIGTRDYLGEQRRKGGDRTRGANYTSTDFAFRFRRKDQKVQLVLGEWKYTEYYSSKDLGTPSNERDKKPEARKKNYRDAFNRNKGVFAGQGEQLYNSLFFEPFYQLMRQQLLGQEMEIGSEMDADIVSVLHISPEANAEYRERVTSPILKAMFPNQGALEIWKRLVAEDKFMSISVEELLNTISERVENDDPDWVTYLRERYRWPKCD